MATEYDFSSPFTGHESTGYTEPPPLKPATGGGYEGPICDYCYHEAPAGEEICRDCMLVENRRMLARMKADLAKKSAGRIVAEGVCLFLLVCFLVFVGSVTFAVFSWAAGL